MARTTVSSKFQVVIPKEIRSELGLKTGEVLHVVGRAGVISLVPDRPVKELRGFLKGMKTRGLREKRDRI
ncbi:MAG TPA: AbrB/MazE/SpoVT family DNA-binding domain-containing protein [Thermoanaerobaculia bacterium]|nr:AbrB/MazE/SpoVT family DNA-binding domain-containing protein [Thermoanaerobaculia bacterium]